jgi:hypothetical protein
MATKKKMNGNAVTVYPYYRHTGQDPMVEKVLAAVSRRTNETMGQTAKKAKLGVGTVKKWQNKKTRRPQHATMAAYLGAAGLAFSIKTKQ